MPKFKIWYGIKGNQFDEEEVEASSEDHAWSIAESRAVDLVAYGAERLDDLTPFELNVQMSKAISAFMELPEEARSQLLEKLASQSKAEAVRSVKEHTRVQLDLLGEVVDLLEGKTNA